MVVKLQDLNPSHQVGFHFICQSPPFPGGRRDSGGRGGRERRGLRGGWNRGIRMSSEDAVLMLKIRGLHFFQLSVGALCPSIHCIKCYNVAMMHQQSLSGLMLPVEERGECRDSWKSNSEQNAENWAHERAKWTVFLKSKNASRRSTWSKWILDQNIWIARTRAPSALLHLGELILKKNNLWIYYQKVHIFVKQNSYTLNKALIC